MKKIIKTIKNNLMAVSYTHLYTLSIATYFILFGSLGVSLYGQREIAYLQNEPKKRSIVFWEKMCIRDR